MLNVVFTSVGHPVVQPLIIDQLVVTVSQAATAPAIQRLLVYFRTAAY